MISQISESSYVDDPVSSTVDTSTVNSHREEASDAYCNATSDDDVLRSDGSTMKYGSRCLKIGTWNVRTLNKLGKFENLIAEATALDVDVFGISETRMIGDGKKN